MLAAGRALWFAKELGFQRLIVEGDSEAVINSINGDYMAQSEFRHILQDISLLSSSFNFVSFCHVKRQGNCVAHRLARRVITCPLEVWMESINLDMLDAYNADLLLID